MIPVKWLTKWNNWRGQLKKLFPPMSLSIVPTIATPPVPVNASDILKRVRKIEIRSKLLSNQVFSGAYHTAFKGRGMQFSEVREYAYGDDIRHIDWNVSARMQSPYVKLFQEEREQTLMLLVDISPSVLTSVGLTDRRELIAELVAVLAYSATHSQDKVGMLLFDTAIRAYFPPSKGYQQILQLIRAVLETPVKEGAGTDFKKATEYLRKVYKGKSLTFLISDYLVNDYKDVIKNLASGNDLTGIIIKDPLDDTLPDVGLVQVEDAETGERQWVDTSSENYRHWYQMQSIQRDNYFKKAFADARCDTIVLSDKNKESYIRTLQQFFHLRAVRR
jgi:uncharacterized protein (DUF58 family)